jgi:hypothetical protein
MEMYVLMCQPWDSAWSISISKQRQKCATMSKRGQSTILPDTLAALPVVRSSEIIKR